MSLVSKQEVHRTLICIKNPTVPTSVCIVYIYYCTAPFVINKNPKRTHHKKSNTHNCSSIGLLGAKYPGKKSPDPSVNTLCKHNRRSGFAFIKRRKKRKREKKNAMFNPAPISLGAPLHCRFPTAFSSSS